NRTKKSRIGNETSGISRVEKVAPRKLMLALRARFDPFQPMRNRIVDRLIVTKLEMQERMMLSRPPVAAVERSSADEINGAGDPATGAARHHQQYAVAHFLADNGKKFTAQVGPPPFARTGFHIKSEKRIPHRLREIGTGQPAHFDAGAQRLLALALDGLALAR